MATVVLRPCDSWGRRFADIARLHFEQPRRAGIGRMKRGPEGATGATRQIALTHDDYKADKRHGWLEIAK